MQEEALLVQALRHRSWCAENPGWESNERLEFLGDSVLGLIVTAHLFRTYPDIPEGERIPPELLDAGRTVEVRVPPRR